MRLVRLHGDEFEFDLYSVPVIGSPDAPKVVFHFFDYSCSHCRELHPLLAAVHDAFPDELALVNCPVPLDPECNPIMKRPIAEHTNACAYAKVALALWKAEPGELPEFEDWFFAFPHPPDPLVVKNEAERRVGTAELAEALEDPWIDRFLGESIRLYHTNYLVFKESRLPLMMIQTNLVSGVVSSTNQLYRLLGLELGEK
jgi:hypothetical protein